MVTSASVLRELIHQYLDNSYPKSVTISEIYDYVEENAEFDDEDHVPPNLRGKPVNEPRWRRNVRNVLKSDSDRNLIIRVRKAEYAMSDSESNMSLAGADQGAVESSIDAVRGNIPSSFVRRHLKLADDRGNGEAKLYVGSVRMKDEYDRFFLGWHPLNTYEFDHVDLLLYLQEVEPEFSRQSKYKGVSKRLYNELMRKVNDIQDLRVGLSSHTDRSRYYIRGSSESWELMRSLAVPLISNLEVERTSEGDDGYGDFRIRIVRSDMERPMHSMSGKRQKAKKLTRRRSKRRTRSVDVRGISTELKDKVWNRCNGMCQANWRIDSSLDKNTGDICGSNENLEFDHIVPFSRGGMTTYRNLQLLCQSHNRMKSDHEV